MSRCRQVASHPCRKRPPAAGVALYTGCPLKVYTRLAEAGAGERAEEERLCGRRSTGSSAAGTAAVVFGSCTAAAAVGTAAVAERICWGRRSRAATGRREEAAVHRGLS